MSRSPYVDNVVLTNKHSGRRTHKVQAFVIHHMAAVWTGKRASEYFRDTPSRQASANYCIGYNGDVALNVEEQNRAWTSSSAWADNRAITYELSNSKYGHPWKVSEATLDKAIMMLAEQHKRYGLKEASYTGDTKGTLWRHDWFAETNCPGPYLGSKLSYIADEVNKILQKKEKVNIVAKDPNPSSWAKTQWNWGVTHGLVTSRPRDTMTRQEAITMLHSYETMNNGGEPSNWAEESWDWAEEIGYMNGQSPKANISRQELAVVLKSFADRNNLK